MKTKSEFYPEIYFIERVEKLSDAQMDSLLMCGNSNWDHYFRSLVSGKIEDVEKIENVELVEFESEKEMFGFLKKLNPVKLLDYSTMHNKPCVLKFA